MRIYKYIRLIILIFSVVFLHAQESISDSSKFKILGAAKVVGLENHKRLNASVSSDSENDFFVTAVGDVKIVGELPNTEIVYLDKTESVFTAIENENFIAIDKTSNKKLNNHSHHKLDNSAKNILLSKVPSPEIFFRNYLKKSFAISYHKKNFDSIESLPLIYEIYNHLPLKENQSHIIVFYDEYVKFHYPIRSPPEHNTTVPLSIIQCTMLNNKV